MFTLKKYHPGRPRWSDEDRHWGPFCFSRTYSPFGVFLRSHDDDGADRPHTVLQVSLLWRTVLMYLPAFLTPRPDQYGDSERRYDFSIVEGSVIVRYPKKSASEGEAVHIYDFPRGVNIRQETLDANGTVSGGVFADLPGAGPEKSIFALKDYDGTEVTATVTTTLRVYRRYGQWLAWLGYLLPREHLYLAEIEFSQAVGRRKDSWKGGIHSTSFHITEPKPHSQIMFDYAKSIGMMPGVKLINRVSIPGDATVYKEPKTSLASVVSVLGFVTLAVIGFLVTVFFMLLSLAIVVSITLWDGAMRASGFLWETAKTVVNRMRKKS